MRLKCCVGGCNATNETHRLFAFPKKDTLRNLWMSFLVPKNPLLLGLTKDQLLRKRVCEKHFDAYQFDGKGKRLRYSYPCLFTDDEITQGVPLAAVGTAEDFEHPSCSYSEVEASVTQNKGEGFYEHPSCSYSEVEASVPQNKAEDFEHPSCSYSEVEASVTQNKGEGFYEHPSCSYSEVEASVPQNKGEDFEHPSCSYSELEASITQNKGEDFEHPSCSYSEVEASVPQNKGEDFEHPPCSYSEVEASVTQNKGEDFEHPSCSYSEVEASVLQNKGEDFEHPPCSYSEVQASVTQNKGEDFYEHPSCSYSEVEASVPQSKDLIVVDEGSSSLPIVIDEDVLEVSSAHREIKPTSTMSHSTQEKELPRKRRGTVMKKLSSKGRKFVNNVINIASSSLGQTSEQRLSQAKSYGSNEQLFKNFDLLNKQAQTFLLMQLKQCRNNKMARRFTMNEKLMALMLMKQSPKAYKLLETMFALPNKRTLHRLAEKISMKPGVNPQIFAHIQNTVKHWGQQQKLCSIVFDEIALTPYLTYNERNDLIHGFVDVAGERKMKFCDHALVFMVRGICSSWRQCISYYFCEGTTSTAEMQEILKHIVSEVAQTGLIPLGLVCDQGSTFRTAIKKFREETIRNCNDENETNAKDDGTISIAGHNLSIFFDTPHLLKGLRNNFLNKNIIWEGKRASWKDIQFIYDIDNRLGNTRAIPKLTAHHVDPDKIKKMKVSVAAQVFSSRMAAMLKYTAAINHFHTGSESQQCQASSTMEATAEIIEFFDTLFDSVNGSPGGATKGKLRKAIKKHSAHHRFWVEAIEKLKKLQFEDTSSKLAKRQANPRMVRVPSLEGWVVTLESFRRISKILFDEYGVEYYYPRNINQDPLENFFGRVRALNYRNVKPNANTFIYTFKSLLLSNLLSPHSKFANCEVDNGETLLDASFLFEVDEDNTDKENKRPNINSLPSTSQHRRSGSNIGAIKNEPILETMKVQCSAYTAGYLCRKISKAIDCESCLKTYISSSKEEHHAYIQYREYKRLKNNNLQYPTDPFLKLYRETSTFIHNFLNINCYKRNVGTDLHCKLSELRISWLGCAEHKDNVKRIFLNEIFMHVHNWCNIINKILKGDIDEKYALKMEEPQKLAYKKYKSHRLRQKTLNK